MTVVKEFQNIILQLFKKADIKSLSTLEIDGHKSKSPRLIASDWFASTKTGNESVMLFSFTDNHHLDILFNLITEFNSNLKTNNPVKAVVVPIEKYI